MLFDFCVKVKIHTVADTIRKRSATPSSNNTYATVSHLIYLFTLGYNEFDFFNTDPLMGAKFKSKTHLPNMFFDFWRRFLRV